MQAKGGGGVNGVGKKCNAETQEWCGEQGLVSGNRSDGPILLMASKSGMPSEQWMTVFKAVSTDIRPWDSMIGTCFREVYIGMNNDINFYVSLETGDTKSKGMQQRQRSLKAFEQLVLTALRTAELRKTINAKPMQEYYKSRHSGLVKLRHPGIGPEDIRSLEVLRAARYQAMADSNMSGDDLLDMRTSRIEETRRMRELVATKLRKYRHQDDEDILASSYQPKRVTFMWRDALKRCIINESDLIEYILSLYNVTVRISTFSESFLDVMDLMNTTDVLIGMHGQGWTNALFLKPGAAALQLHPFGWTMPPGNETLRGFSYRNVALARNAFYRQWVNPYASHAFMRQWEWESQKRKGNPIPYPYSMHPLPHWPTPADGDSRSHWVYGNTLVSVNNIAPILDDVMRAVGARRNSNARRVLENVHGRGLLMEQYRTAPAMMDS